MEKSSGYFEKLNEIRKLPHETEEEIAEKREKAKLFRMEVLLDNAKCAQLLTEALYENPRISLSALLNKLQEESLLAHPDAAAHFLANLAQARMQVNQAIKTLKEMSHVNDINLAHVLFDDLTFYKKLDREVLKQVDAVVDLSNPLALMLFVQNSEDYKKIDPRDNIGGFYNPELGYKNHTTRQEDKFPIIVVNDVRSNKENIQPDSIEIVEHEKGHAEHNVFHPVGQKSLPSKSGYFDHHLVWGRVELNDPEEMQIELEEKWKKNPSMAYESDEWKKIMQFAITKAKDELLAEYRAHDGLNTHYLNPLLKKDGVYDYFDRLGFEKGSLLYDALWAEYKNTVESAQAASAYIVNSYFDTGFNMKPRRELFRWVLAQIPLEQWEEQLSKSYFQKEARLLYDMFYRVRDENKFGLSTFKAQDPSGYEEFISELKELSDGGLPLLPLLNKYSDKIERKT